MCGNFQGATGPITLLLYLREIETFLGVISRVQIVIWLDIYLKLQKNLSLSTVYVHRCLFSRALVYLWKVGVIGSGSCNM